MEKKRTSAGKKVGLALHVNRQPGVPMLESTCECGFIKELDDDRMVYESQVPMPIAYKSGTVKQRYRADFVLNGKMIVELKGSIPPAS